MRNIDVKVEIANNIVMFRRAKKWNRTILAKKSGITKKIIEKYENQKLIIKTNDLYNISRALDISIMN